MRSSSYYNQLTTYNYTVTKNDTPTNANGVAMWSFTLDLSWIY